MGHNGFLKMTLYFQNILQKQVRCYAILQMSHLQKGLVTDKHAAEKNLFHCPEPPHDVFFNQEK